MRLDESEPSPAQMPKSQTAHTLLHLMSSETSSLNLSPLVLVRDTLQAARQIYSVSPNHCSAAKCSSNTTKPTAFNYILQQTIAQCFAVIYFHFRTTIAATGTQAAEATGGVREKTSGRGLHLKKSTSSLPSSALSQHVMWNLRGANSKSTSNAAAASAHGATGTSTCVRIASICHANCNIFSFYSTLSPQEAR